MYLTRFPLNLSLRQTRSMLANPYRMHAAVAASFPPMLHSDSAEGRILWRVDRPSDGGALLYIASPERPSLKGLDEQIGWSDLEPQWETRSYDGLFSRLRKGQQWAFRLVANPVVNRTNIPVASGQNHSKRLGHLTVVQQAAWLIGKQAYVGTGVPVPELFAHQDTTRANRSGFEVLANDDTGVAQLVVSQSRKVSFGPDKRKNITLEMAQYDGLLEITDVDALKHALCFGIGHGKGFGCGLLTLAPPR